MKSAGGFRLISPKGVQFIRGVEVTLNRGDGYDATFCNKDEGLAKLLIPASKRKGDPFESAQRKVGA